MDKMETKDWVSSLETMVDNKLKKWKKDNKIENGEAVHLGWQYEQTHLIIDIFWQDAKESVHLHYIAPRASHRFTWDGLTNKTMGKIEDRVGNLAQMTMNPRE